jgi:hypothetical protein
MKKKHPNFRLCMRAPKGTPTVTSFPVKTPEKRAENSKSRGNPLRSLRIAKKTRGKSGHAHATTSVTSGQDRFR